MSKAGLIALLGFLSAVLPFLGIPSTFKTWAAVAFGVLIVLLGFLVREEKKWIIRALNGDHQKDAYTENGISNGVAGEGYAQEINKELKA